LIVRSHCSLDTVNFTTGRQDVDVFHYQSFLEQLSTVTTFKAPAWVTSVSIARKVHHELLPVVTQSDWSVFPDGLEAFLDWADAQCSTASDIMTSGEFKIYLACLGGPGLAEVRDRYRRSLQVYQHYQWLDLSVFDLEAGLDMQRVKGSDEGEGLEEDG
jgi:hypothetical protein